MTDEQFERRMDFVVEQQAKFAVDIQQLKEAQERTDGMVRQLVAVNFALTGHVQGLAGQVQNLAHHLEAVDERLARLADSQAHTDQRFDALINVVDSSFGGTAALPPMLSVL